MSEVDIGLPTFNVGDVASSASSALVSVVLWLLLIAVVAGVLFGIFYLAMFKHRVRVKQSVRGRTIVIDDKARIYKDRNGAVWWKFLKTKLKVSPPPSDAVDINKKGKFIAEGYLVEDGRFIWRIDDFNKDKVEQHDNSFNGNYHFFSSDERALLAGEVIEAQQYKKKKIADLLVAAAPYIAIIFIFVLFLVFFDNVVTPAIELGKSIQASHELQLETMKIMQNIIQNKEMMLLDATNIPN